VGGVDLGIPRNSNRIRIAPRNAHNGIVPGDNYQLLYWNNGWVPAETKKTVFNFIEFENIPSKTLFWLRNLDHGKEEQPFLSQWGTGFFKLALFLQLNIVTFVNDEKRKNYRSFFVLAF
jgi:hypothetical protein